MGFEYKLNLLKQSETGDTRRTADRTILDICKDNEAILLTALPDRNDGCWYFSTDKELTKAPDFVESLQVPHV
jgi:hypothetical protein